MKKILFLFIVIAIAISCNEKDRVLCYTECTTSEFSFINEENNDFFLNDSCCTIENFEITSIEGFANVHEYYLSEDDNLYHFIIGFGEVPHRACTTLFHFGNETDTIIVKFNQEGCGYYIEKLYYNGELIEDNDDLMWCGTHSHKILKWH